MAKKSSSFLLNKESEFALIKDKQEERNILLGIYFSNLQEITAIYMVENKMRKKLQGMS